MTDAKMTAKLAEMRHVVDTETDPERRAVLRQLLLSVEHCNELKAMMHARGVPMFEELLRFFGSPRRISRRI